MRLDLSSDEAETLRGLLHDFLPDLRREVARTEVLDFRHELLKRQDLCERLFGLLEEKLARSG